MTDWRVELCRRSYAAWAAHDPDALRDVWSEESEWDMGPVGATGLGPVYRGHDGLSRMFEEITGAFAAFAPRIIELRLFGEAVLVRGDAIGTSELMGAEITTAPFGQVIEFEPGRILRVTQTDDPPPHWEDAQPVE